MTTRRRFIAGLLASAAAPVPLHAAARLTDLEALKAFFRANPGPHYRFKDWSDHRGNVQNFAGVPFTMVKEYSA